MDCAKQSTGRDDAAWALITLTAFLFVVLQAVQPFRIEVGGLIVPAALLLLLLGASAAARLAPRTHQLADALPFFRQVLAFSCIGAALSYQVSAHAGALWDPAFRVLDRGLGFDSSAFLRFLNDRPLLSVLNTAMYHSLVPQMVIALLALAACGNQLEMRVLMLASIAAGLVAIFVSALMPAMGNLYSPNDYPRLGSSAAWLHKGDVEGLRAGTLRTLDLGQMKGIVTFPSYHAALATIYISAFRVVPVLRWIGCCWALCTIAATPAGGGHYLVDVGAGMLVALAALKFAGKAVYWNASAAITAALMRVKGAPAGGRG